MGASAIALTRSFRRTWPKHGFQTRDAEMALARLLGDLVDS